jgi:hypothetical protein
MTTLFTLSDLPMSFEAVDDDLVMLRLYCWPCRTVHEFKLKDIERIVYSLGAAEILAYDSGYQDAEDKIERTRPADGPSACLLTALRDAGNSEVFAEHVEQGVECREAADCCDVPTGIGARHDCEPNTGSVIRSRLIVEAGSGQTVEHVQAEYPGLPVLHNGRMYEATELPEFVMVAGKRAPKGSPAYAARIAAVRRGETW